METAVTDDQPPKEPILSPREPVDREFRDLCLLNGISDKHLKKHGTDNIKELDIFLSTTVSLSPLKQFHNLEKAVVIGNTLITALSELSTCLNLVHLCVNECSISSIDGIESLVSLKRLYLCANRLADVDKIARLPCLESVWLNDNFIQDIGFISNNLNLKSLWVCNNVIRQIPSAEGLNQLEEVILAGNRICSFHDLSFLGTFSAIKSFSLQDCHFGSNIVCNVSNYKAFVITSQSSIQVLDGEHLTDEMRNQSLSIFAKKSLYYDMRSRLFKNLSSNFLSFGTTFLSNHVSLSYNHRKTVGKANRILDLISSNPLEFRDIPWPSGVEITKADIASEAADLDIATIGKGQAAFKEFQDSINLCISWAHALFDVEFRSGGNIRLDECSSSSRESNRCMSILTAGRIDYDTLRVFRVTNKFLKDKFDKISSWMFEDKKFLEFEDAKDKNDSKKKKSAKIPKSPRGRKLVSPIIPLLNRSASRVLSCFFVVEAYSAALMFAERGLDRNCVVYRTVDKALEKFKHHTECYLCVCRICVSSDEPLEEDFVMVTDSAQIITEYILYIFVGQKNATGQSPLNSSRKRWQESVVMADSDTVCQESKEESGSAREWSNSFSDCIPSSRATDMMPAQSMVSFPSDPAKKRSLQEQLKFRSTGAVSVLKELRKKGLLPQSLASSTDQSMIYDMLPFASALMALKSRLGSGCIEKDDIGKSVESQAQWSFSEDLLRLSSFGIAPLSANGKTHVSLIRDTMPFISFQFIAELSLHGRGISDILGEFSAFVPVLERLDLSFNLLQDVTFLTNSNNLQWLDLSYNRITSFGSIPTMSVLSHLSLKGNCSAEDVCGQATNYSSSSMERASSKLPKLASLDLTDTKFELSLSVHDSKCRNWMSIRRYFPSLQKLNGELYADLSFFNPPSDEENKISFERKGLDSMLDFFCKNIGCHLSWYNKNMSFQDICRQLEVRISDVELYVKGLWIDGNGLSRISDILNVLLTVNRSVSFPLAIANDSQEISDEVDIKQQSETIANLGFFLLHLSAEDNCLDSNGLLILSKFSNLISLNLAGNFLTSLIPLSQLKNVRRLCIERNSVVSLSGIENMTHLRALYASNNKVDRLSDVSKLSQDHQHLLVLDLSFNPCSMKPDYKDFVIFKLQSLKVFDSSTISKKESQEAQRKFSGRLTWEILSPYSEENIPVLKAFMSSSLRNVELIGMHASQFSKLKELDLSDNQLVSFSCLSSLVCLERLVLNKNLIQGTFELEEEGDIILSKEKKSGPFFPSLVFLSLVANKVAEPRRLYIGLMKSLVDLNLAQNAIGDWETEVTSQSLRRLNLSENRVRQLTLGSFGGLLRLDDVNLQKNGLRSPSQLGNMVLTRLDLSMNRFQHVDSILQLTSQCSMLKSICVYSNPFSRKPGYIHLFLVHLPTLEMVDGQLVTIEDRLRACQVVSNEKNALQEQWLLLQQRLYEYQYLQQLNQAQGLPKDQGQLHQQQQLVSQWQVQARQQQQQQPVDQVADTDQPKGQQFFRSHSPLPIAQKPSRQGHESSAAVAKTSKETVSFPVTFPNQAGLELTNNPFVALLNSANKQTQIPWPPNKKSVQIIIPTSTGIVGTQLQCKNTAQQKRSSSQKPPRVPEPNFLAKNSENPTSLAAPSYRVVDQSRAQDESPPLGHQFQLLSNEARDRAVTKVVKVNSSKIPTPRIADAVAKPATQDDDNDDSKDNPRTRRLWELFAPLWTNVDNPQQGMMRRASGTEMPLIVPQAIPSPREARHENDPVVYDKSKQVFRHPTMLPHRTPESIIQQASLFEADKSSVTGSLLINLNKVAINDKPQAQGKMNTPRSPPLPTNLPPVNRKTAGLLGSYAYYQSK